MVERDVIAWLESWSEELSSQANRVRNLIGDAHWLTDGAHKERLLSNFIDKFIFEPFEVTKGFICSCDPTSNISPEIDVLIADKSAHPPWYRSDDLIIAPPESTCAFVQVKSSWTKKNLELSFRNLVQSHLACSNYKDNSQLWSGIFLYNKSSIKFDDRMQQIATVINLRKL